MLLSASLIAGVLSLAAKVTADANVGTLGFAVGATNPDGTCKSTDDYVNDFNVLKDYTSLIRTYSMSDCYTLANILPALESTGMTAILGIWAGPGSTYETSFQYELGNLTTYATQYSSAFTSNVVGITVGSEVLYRGDLTPDELVSRIKEVKTTASGVGYSGMVGTADSWNMWTNSSNNAVIEAVDLILTNAFPYWQSIGIDSAGSSFFNSISSALASIQSVNANAKFYVGETGWPTEGTTLGSAVPSVDNAQQFWKEGVCAMREWGVDVFVFEAFDEPDKASATSDGGVSSDVESHWGVFTSDFSKKFSLDC
ncbi:glycoside hydrolase [Saitoella complicata NRRL Y-17804]|nr:glycoside hydrolase [Saitoella complicata NRRL Y-17804]ODQ52251.1 glycoside hydrolase [Saitoella complicata NRRL Y-17804]